MEEVTSVMSVVDGVDSVDLTTDALALALSNEGISYIIHLPSNVNVNGQIITEDDLLNQAAFIIENKPLHITTFPEQETDSTQFEENNVSLTFENNEAIFVDASTLPSSITSSFVDVSEALQYSADDNGSGGIVLDEEQKCAVENLLEFHNQQGAEGFETSENPVACDSSITDAVADENIIINHEVLKEKMSISELGSSVQEDKVSFTEVRIEEISEAPGLACNLESKFTATIPLGVTEQSNSTDHVIPSQSQSRQIKTYGKSSKIQKELEASASSATPLLTESLESNVIPNKVLKLGKIVVSKPQRVVIPLPVKKRRIILDSQKQIPVPEFKRQLIDTKDIVNQSCDFAPATKLTMKNMESGVVSKFFASPGRPIMNVPFSRLFSDNLIMTVESSDGSPHSDDIVPLDSDLRISSPSENGIFLESGLSLNHSSQNINKRSINVRSHSIETMFKGISRAPTLREYYRKTQQRKANLCFSQKLLRGKPLTTETRNPLSKTESELEITESNALGKSSPHMKSEPTEIEIEKCNDDTYIVGDNDSMINSHSNGIDLLTTNVGANLDRVKIETPQNESENSDLMSPKSDSNVRFSTSDTNADSHFIIADQEEPYGIQTEDDLKLWVQASPS